MIIILQDRGNKKKQTAPCHLQDYDMICRGLVCCGLREKWWIGAVLKGIFPVSYSSFPPALEQGFLPEHTDSYSPCTT